MRKNKKKNNSNNKLYPILLVIATLFMGIGYAMVNSVTLEVEGSSFALLQDGVFITEVNYKSNVEADTTGSTINYALGTMVDSHIVLGSVDNSTITYQIVVYNNTDKEQMFIGVLTDNADDELSSNANIEYSLSGLLEYTTTIAPKSSIDFTITFKYATGADLTQNTLDSKLNFRFKEVPRLFLNNEGETYTLSDIYPDYTPQEYIFTVSNYNETVTNSVPMTYYFETTIDSPLTAKIYDESGNEVTEGITIESNGEEVEHTYTLKIIWDNSNPEDDIDYNNADEYADREFQCYVVLKAIPTEEKYMDYVMHYRI